MYELDKPVRSFAIANDFVVQMNKVCYQLGINLQPFCLFANEKQQEYEVIDFTQFGGFVNEDVDFVEELCSERRAAYKTIGMFVPEGHERLLMYDYLLSCAMCYVEIPKWVTKNGVPTATFDKFLCTRNPAVMAAWMGQPQMTMQAKYSSRIAMNEVFISNDEIRFAKLVAKADGNTISVPRTSSSVKDMTCIPVFMMHAFMAGVKTRLDKEIVQFSFLKDNGTVRELASTLNEDIIMSYYNDNQQLAKMVGGIDIATVNQGGMLLPSKINRGYVKIPELGASRYDESGCRSLNLARVLKAEVVQDIDRTYIDVDLNSVVENFSAGIDYIQTHKLCSLKEVYEEFVSEECVFDSDAAIAAKLKEWATSRVLWLSTTFMRDLHKLMVGHPLWFPYYTGRPVVHTSGSLPSGDFEDAAPLEF